MVQGCYGPYLCVYSPMGHNTVGHVCDGVVKSTKSHFICKTPRNYVYRTGD